MRLFSHCFFLVAFFFSVLLSAQDNFDTKILEVQRFMLEGNNKDAEKELQSLQKISEPNNLIKVYASFVDLYVMKKEYTSAFYYLSKSEKLYESSKDPLDHAYVLFSIARLSFARDSYKNTIQNSTQALTILNDYPTEHLLKTKLYRILNSVNSSTSSMSDDYRKNVFKALNEAQHLKLPSLTALCISDIASMYMTANNNKSDAGDRIQLVNYTEKLIHYIETHRKEISNTKMEIIIYNNYASMVNDSPYKNLSLKQRGDLAEKYILKAINLAEKEHLQSNYSIIYTTYAEIFLNRGENEKAEQYFLKSYNLADKDKATSTNSHLSFALDHLAEINKKRNNLEKALEFKELSNKFNVKRHDQKMKEKNEFLQAYYYSTENFQRMIDLENQSLKLSRQRNISIAVVVFAILFIAFLIYTSKAKGVISRQKTELLVSEKNEAELQLQLEFEEKARLKAEQELLALQQEQLKKQAMAATLQLEQNNTFIYDIKEKLRTNSEISWNQILKEQKLKDDDFQQIQTAIQEVHPHFFRKLKEVSQSKLSPMDLKYASYIYLNIDNHQIANILNVAQNTVRMSKYRLKQKIGLGKDEDLTEFLHNLQI